MKKQIIISCAVSIILSLLSCAAKLPREVTIKRPFGLEAVVNLSDVSLVRLGDGGAVNVGTYMKERGLEWLVLTFGSKSCGACMEKARYFQANLVGNNYGLLGESARGRFELIGVATDPGSDRDELLALVEDEGLSHLAWSDPAPLKDKMMMKYFQPAGMDFSVPLTVMLSRDGILWRVTSKDKLSPAEIVQKIAAVIDADIVTPPPGSGESGGGTLLRPLLAEEVPSRLDQVKLKSCLDRNDVRLGAELPPAPQGLRGVLVYRGKCDESAECMDARNSMRSWQARCALSYAASCDFRELAIDDESVCDRDRSLLGGQEFFEVFADHFSWSYQPIQSGPGRMKLPDIKGPLTLVFDSLGRLVFSREGMVGEAIDREMEQSGLANRAAGPRFGLMYEDGFANQKIVPTRLTFDRLRLKAKYTVVMFWNTWCSSCTEELDEWHSEVDSAYQFCRSNKDFCQVVALETGREESGLSPDRYLVSLVNGNDDFDGWLSKRWTMPLAVETEPETDGSAPMGWFGGWVRARFGSSEPRTVLYDIEGKVVNTWRSLPGEHGPRDTLKKLYEIDSEQRSAK